MAYTYDENGNTTLRVDGDVHVTVSKYDGDNRLLSQIDYVNLCRGDYRPLCFALKAWENV